MAAWRRATLLDGGEEAFAALVDRWYGSSVRLARLLGSDEATAQPRRPRGVARCSMARLDELPEDSPPHLVALRATIETLAAKLAAGDGEPGVRPGRLRGGGHALGRLVARRQDTGAVAAAARGRRRSTRALAELEPAIGRGRRPARRRKAQRRRTSSSFSSSRRPTSASSSTADGPRSGRRSAHERALAHVLRAHRPRHGLPRPRARPAEGAARSRRMPSSVPAAACSSASSARP